jgi:hypothetical protein
MVGACSTDGKDDAYKILLGESEERDHLEDLGIDARMILEWISEK